MTGKRFDRKDAEQSARLERLAEIFAEFGPGNVKTMLALSMPKWLMWKLPFLDQFTVFFKNIFSWFEAEYNEHEKTFDPNSLRDFTDV